jgi:hypothetical protein
MLIVLDVSVKPGKPGKNRTISVKPGKKPDNGVELQEITIELNAQQKKC